ncbi:MAG: hypothetical protein DI533_20350 [Cereibacter sphaeroides]|uniref:Phage tail protein n=1 Tax=Cereibacter sphaeroides TaxID=1063 RepID=A0A2W5S810_CERSP|nr:MAG: hypothetical protein DI533_20350 [Cereibacter sphaeroides]
MLSEEDRILYTARLKEAEAALHQGLLGGGVRTFVDQNGERVEYNAANPTRLRAYIIELKLALGLPTGISGPMRAIPW